MTTHLRMSDGCHLAVTILGAESKDEAEFSLNPLFIVHHSALGASDHRETEKAYGFLAERFRVLVFDARGCGGSDKLGEEGDEVSSGEVRWELSHERLVEDIEELRQWAGADSFYLAGNSYGALIAISYALAYPSHLDGLLLRAGLAYGPAMAENALAKVTGLPGVSRERQERLWSGRLRGGRDFAKALGEIGYLLSYQGQHAAARLDADAELERDEQQDEVKEGEGEGEGEGEWEKGEEGYNHLTHNVAFSTLLPGFDVRARLGDITCSTLVVVGRWDWLTPPDAARDIAEGVKRGKLVVFEASGHDPTSEEEGRWTREVWQWLGDKGV